MCIYTKSLLRSTYKLINSFIHCIHTACYSDATFRINGESVPEESSNEAVASPHRVLRSHITSGSFIHTTLVRRPASGESAWGQGYFLSIHGEWEYDMGMIHLTTNNIYTSVFQMCSQLFLETCTALGVTWRSDRQCSPCHPFIHITAPTSYNASTLGLISVPGISL